MYIIFICNRIGSHCRVFEKKCSHLEKEKNTKKEERSHFIKYTSITIK